MRLLHMDTKEDTKPLLGAEAFQQLFNKDSCWADIQEDFEVQRAVVDCTCRCDQLE